MINVKGNTMNNLREVAPHSKPWRVTYPILSPEIAAIKVQDYLHLFCFQSNQRNRESTIVDWLDDFKDFCENEELRSAANGH